jgi:hypothetical protein
MDANSSKTQGNFDFIFQRKREIPRAATLPQGGIVEPDWRSGFKGAHAANDSFRRALNFFS